MNECLRYLLIMILIVFVAVPRFSHAVPDPTTDNKSITVTVQVYSSRADPSFDLKQDSDEVNQIKMSIETAPIIDIKGRRVPSILGYHGILIDNPQRIPGLPGHIRVYKGIIEISGKKKEHRSDQDRALEKFLIKEAKKAHVVDNDLLKQTGVDVSTGD